MTNFHKSVLVRIGENIRKERLKKGMDQIELAERCDISRSHFSRIEHGLTRINVEQLFRITKALSVSSSDLLPF